MPKTTLRNEREDIDYNGVVHKRSVSADHIEERRLKANMGCHNPTGVIMQTH